METTPPVANQNARNNANRCVFGFKWRCRFFWIDLYSNRNARGEREEAMEEVMEEDDDGESPQMSATLLKILAAHKRKVKRAFLIDENAVLKADCAVLKAEIASIKEKIARVDA